MPRRVLSLLLDRHCNKCKCSMQGQAQRQASSNRSSGLFVSSSQAVVANTVTGCDACPRDSRESADAGAVASFSCAQMVESAQAFQITQFGLSAFKWEGGRYVARTFNFYVFPRPTEGFDRRFLSQVWTLV